MNFGLVYYFVLFAVVCATWWAPYIFGASQNWLDIYTRIHSKTITVVPRRGSNPAPNLEHLILMGLTVAVAVLTLRQFKELHPEPIGTHGLIGQLASWPLRAPQAKWSETRKLQA